jgi:hypothetical protein
MTEIKMALSKKHFEQAAQVIRTQLSIAADQRLAEDSYGAEVTTKNARRVMNDLASIFEDDNPRFDRARFVAACGFEG